MGRILLFVAAALLLAAALIHAAGQPMVEGWIDGLDYPQRQAICLVWITDSIDWAVVALLWAIAGWKRQRGWLGGAAIAAAIPFAMFIGIMAIEPRFFGGWMLLGSTVLAAVGIGLSWRKTGPAG